MLTRSIIIHALRNIDNESLAGTCQKHPVRIAKICFVILASYPGPIRRGKSVAHLIMCPLPVFNAQVCIPSNNSIIQLKTLCLKFTGHRFQEITGSYIIFRIQEPVFRRQTTAIFSVIDPPGLEAGSITACKQSISLASPSHIPDPLFCHTQITCNINRVMFVHCTECMVMSRIMRKFIFTVW